MNIYDQFKDKKLAILGFGLEGKSTFNLLTKHGLKPAVIDRTDENSFRQKNPDLPKETELKLGNDYLNSLDQYEVIFKSPGIPILTDEIQSAIKKGVVFTSQLELFFQICPSGLIGVTGTKGKGTTSSLISEILKNTGKKVLLGGNIGVPAIDLLDEVTEESKVVLELSSFQLQTLKQSPNIAVVLNVTSDHLDYHKSVFEYREAKMNIVKFQKETDYAVINADYEVPLGFAEKTKAKKRYFSKEKPVEGCYVQNGQIYLETKEGVLAIAKTGELQLRGRHNLENITAACLAAYLAGADIGSIIKTVKKFKGLEHRLELVRDLNGIKYYNDSFSTVPETAIAAVRSFEEPKIVILGGSYKGSDYKELGEVIRRSNTKAAILIGEMADEISKALGSGFSGKKITGLTNMADMVKTASDLAEKGDVVLLSPACASFGLFENYKDRGKQFKEAVSNLG
jgi:UDP-N-acetylmuramoylalanine--D-glutamate ligase